MDKKEKEFELSYSDILKNRRTVKAAVETAHVVSGDIIKAKSALKPKRKSKKSK